MTPTTVADELVASLLGAGRYNHDDKVQPAAVLWPDPERVFEPLLPQLRTLVPILTLGDYLPESLVGPAIWIRAVLGGGVEIDRRPDAWVIYLPGVDRADVRAIESSDSNVRPIAELQFRSTWWVQSNQAPWTPRAFLRSVDGLGLEVARDENTKQALALALAQLGLTSVEDLRARGRIDSNYLTSLLSRDEVKTLLEWLDEPAALQARLSENEWAAFLVQCANTFKMNPLVAGRLSVAQQVGGRNKAWAIVWERYTEAPNAYPNIPQVLRQARPAGELITAHPDSWPDDNDSAEDSLRAALHRLAADPPPLVRSTIADLETEHGPRREWVWAKLGHAPLAQALRYMAGVAQRTAALPDAGSIEDFASWYADLGWRVDSAAIDALASVADPAGRDAVGAALRAMYLPWLDDTARRFQDLAVEAGRVGETCLIAGAGDCVLFVDGLRYDVGERLRTELSARGLNAEIEARVAPFPTMTSCGKPAVAPLDAELTDAGEMHLESGGKVVDAAFLRVLLNDAGVTSILEGETGNLFGRGWTEIGDLDTTGHKLALKLVDRIPAEVSLIAARIQELLVAGWARVHVVTDHGWLLIPGGLPKVELPQHLTSSRKSRCARLTSGAGDVDQPTLKWTWDDAVRMVSPRGVAAFQAGCIYEHGGLSPQESVIPHMIVTTGSKASAAQIEQVKWIGMRCRVDVVDAPAGAVVDLRPTPGDATGSLISAPVPVVGEDEAKVLVEDDGLIGDVAYVVLLSDSGEILAQLATRVGGE